MEAENDHEHIDTLRHKINNFLSDEETQGLYQKKHIILTIHLDRANLVEKRAKEYSISYLKGWTHLTIDSLSKEDYIDIIKLRAASQ